MQTSGRRSGAAIHFSSGAGGRRSCTGSSVIRRAGKHLRERAAWTSRYTTLWDIGFRLQPPTLGRVFVTPSRYRKRHQPSRSFHQRMSALMSCQSQGMSPLVPHCDTSNNSAFKVYDNSAVIAYGLCLRPFWLRISCSSPAPGSAWESEIVRVFHSSVLLVTFL